MGDNTNLVEILSDNPYFIPAMSSDEIYLGQDMSTCLTDEVLNRALINHAHSEYALTAHTHTEYASSSDLELLEDVVVTKANASHTHTEYAALSHAHTDYVSSVELDALAEEVAGKASTSHSHSEYASNSHTHDNYAPSSHNHSEYSAIGHDHDEDYASIDHIHSDYATMSALNEVSATVSSKANVSHSHDDRYYTETEINTKLANKADSSHTHTAASVGALPVSLIITDENGGVKYSYTTNDAVNILTVIANLGKGVHTVYSQVGVTGNPKAIEAWRFLVHKTQSNYGWVEAFGSLGSVYSNYIDGGTWRGWKCLYDASNNIILWSGAVYMQSTNSNPQTITPSKKLSECRTGWLLLWSDYDVGAGENDTDFATTFIPKYSPSGGVWDGKAFLCDIPMYVGGTAEDISTEKRCIKPVYVHDNCLKGSYQNTSGGRNDVVLRAVYEI